MQVHAESKSLILKLRDPGRVTQVIPKSRIVPVDGTLYTQVKLTLDTARVLRNMGIKAPSPIRYFYDWPSKYPSPMAHQVTTAEFFTLFPRGICLNEMGTAKTLSAIWAADYMMREGAVRKAIIVCPKSTTESVWADEILSNLLSRRSYAVLTGTRERRLKQLAKDVDFYIINHDGIGVIADAIQKRHDINLWIYDEASAVRNSQSKRHKLLKKLLKPTDLLWLLTGTPCPRDPTQVWGLAKLIGSRNIPNYFTMFRDETMFQVSEYKWLPKPDAFERAYQALQPSIRFLKKDCVDIPPVTFTTLMAELTKEQRDAYEGMRNELVAEVRGISITAAHAATKMQKLLQISTGVVYDQYSDAHYLDAAPRLKVLTELIDESSNNVIVFVPYKRALHHLAAKLKEAAGKGDDAAFVVETVDGDTSGTARRDIFSRFQNSPERTVLVAHPGTTAHGLTLTRADLTVWYGPIIDLEIFEQANNRMNRPGQKNPMTVACIASTPMELEVYSMLKSKQLVQDTVLAMFKNELGMPNDV